MSAFIIITLDSIVDNDIVTLKNRLLSLANDAGIGIFFERFIEPFESVLNYKCSFSITDSSINENCEDLVKPWWYSDSSVKLYYHNMRIIKRIIRVCLMYTKHLELWIGTSGDLISDFDSYHITVDGFVLSISYQYKKYSQLPPPPSIHFIISS